MSEFLQLLAFPLPFFGAFQEDPLGVTCLLQQEASVERDPLSPGPRVALVSASALEIFALTPVQAELQAFHLCGLFPLQGPSDFSEESAAVPSMFCSGVSRVSCLF